MGLMTLETTKYSVVISFLCNLRRGWSVAIYKNVFKISIDYAWCRDLIPKLLMYRFTPAIRMDRNLCQSRAVELSSDRSKPLGVLLACERDLGLAFDACLFYS